MRKLAISALAALACWPAAAGAATPKDVARSLARDPVFAEPGADPGIDEAEAGRIRVRIAERDPGRIKIAVVRDADFREAGGAARFANAVDRDFDVRGALVVVGGTNMHVVVSYPLVDETVTALRGAVEDKQGDGLAEQLLEGVNRIANVDPGPRGDGGGDEGGGVGGPVGEEAEKVLGAIKVAVLLVAGAIALPFLLGAVWMVLRLRRRRVEEREALAADRDKARDELVALGDQIRALDLDESMPDANPEGKVAYEKALAAYERADGAMVGAPTRTRLRTAAAALSEGREWMDLARRLLERQSAQP